MELNLSLWWIAFAIVTFATFFELRAAVQEREYHAAGGFILGIVFGSLAIYNTENCIFCLSENLLDGSIYGGVALTFGINLVSYIYCRIRY